MKRALIVIVVIAGVGGLIALMSYKPTGSSANQTVNSPQTTTTPGPLPAGVTYKDGSYTGDAVDVGYGLVQIQAVISGGKITSVNFLQMPSDQNHSVEVTNMAEPILLQEAITTQTAAVDAVSGATASSGGFVQSLGSALKQAS
jgi:uncharacterized protein with FMN-binding domain